jgi:hypothetical protein
MKFILFTILFTASVILHIQAAVIPAVIEGKSLWKRNDDMALLEREENINLERQKRQGDEIYPPIAPPIDPDIDPGIFAPINPPLDPGIDPGIFAPIPPVDDFPQVLEA